MFIAWGAHRSMLYNDSYISVLAGKHPWALGRPAQEVWAEIWHILGPHWHHVFNKGEGTWAEDLLLLMNRSGYDEETYFTFSYSPIRGEGGIVEGMFCACQETTEKVVGERRLKTLRELAAQAALGKSPEAAVEMAMKTLSGNPADVPFALFYLLGEDGRTAFRTGIAGFGTDERDRLSCPETEAEDLDGWPLGRVLHEGVAQVIDKLPARLNPLSSGPWKQPATRAILLPIQFAAHEKPSGILISGVSPVRPLDEGYRTFFEVAAGQIASAVANARAYQQERKRAEALAEIDRAKTVFFSNVSHEFRTPLTLMLGPVEDLLATSNVGLPPAAKGQLEIVNRNGLRLLRLVNTLLDFSRIEAGRVQAVYEPTDLAAFTTELASVFRAATERAGLRLSVVCQRLPELVYVDRDMWEKVVLNLVSNAFKFTLEGEIEVSLRAADGAAELRVRDTGVGIPAEEMPRIFERFHRVQNMRSRTHEGSGIGLALVQELIKLHGGTVRAESRLNEGTTFIVRVPLGKDHLPQDRIDATRNLASTAVGAAPFVEEALRWLPEQPAVEEGIEAIPKNELLPIPSPQEPDEKRPWVIVADDNADMRQYLVRILSERYNVKPVPDGQAALSAARERRPDLILSDIMMPGLDGFALLREIRADELLKTVPVILLSARAGEESRVEGLQHGADDYLIKPFSARELLARVGAHLEMARIRKESEKALLQSETRYRTLFDTMLEGFCIVEMVFDPEGNPVDYRFLEINSAFERQTGLHDARGKLMRDLAQDHEAHWFEIYGKVAITGEPAHFMHEAKALHRWYEVYAYRVGGQESRQVAIMFNDITERKQAEEKLREREQRLRMFYHSGIVGMFSWHLDGRITEVNDRYLEMVGYTREDFEAGRMKWAEMTPPEYEPLDRHAIEELAATGLDTPYEKEFIRKDGSRVPVLLGAATVNEDRTEGVAFVLDVSEGRRAEEALRRSEQRYKSLHAELEVRVQERTTELQRKNRELQDFAFIASHDLNEPLRKIQTLGSLLASKGADGWSEENRDYISRITGSACRMQELLAALLNYSRIEAKGESFKPAPLDDVVRDAISDMEVEIRAAGAQLSVGNLPTIMGDPNQLRQLFQNLIGNAIKYRRLEVSPTIDIRGAENNGQCRILVEDNGIGFDEKYLENFPAFPAPPR
jgi:PAS domain S-box-containing protein